MFAIYGNNLIRFLYRVQLVKILPFLAIIWLKVLPFWQVYKLFLPLAEINSQVVSRGSKSKTTVRYHTGKCGDYGVRKNYTAKHSAVAEAEMCILCLHGRIKGERMQPISLLLPLQKWWKQLTVSWWKDCPGDICLTRSSPNGWWSNRPQKPNRTFYMHEVSYQGWV